MSTLSIDPAGSATAARVLAVDTTSARKPAPRASSAAPAARPAPAPAPAPAATTKITQIPASVDADDRATYLQLLKASGGNVNVALAQLQAMESKEKGG